LKKDEGKIQFYTKTIIFSEILNTKCSKIIKYHKVHKGLDKSTKYLCADAIGQHAEIYRQHAFHKNL